MLPPPGRGGRRSEGYVVEGGSGREISARASGGGRVDGISFRVGSTGGRQVRRERASGERRRGIFGRRSTRMAREKITKKARVEMSGGGLFVPKAR